MTKPQRAARILILVVVVACVMAYFVRPRDSSLKLVTLQQELPDPKANYSVESGLSQRISKSYGIALVLMISEYSHKNAIALEAIRGWAHENFERDPAFLHSPEISPPRRNHLSILDAFCFSLLEGPRELLEEEALLFLRGQIAGFHKSKAFQSFRADYFDSFGLDRESAQLLARYESEKAHQAVGVILSFLYWLATAILGTVLFFKDAPAVRSSREQRALAYFWFATATFYIAVAWVCNDVSVLVSSLGCALIGLYLRRPIAVSFGEDKGLSFKLLVPSARVLALASWTTLSLVVIQMWIWIHCGTLAQPDPVTLLISTITGDFVHNPLNVKKYILYTMGVVWLLASLLALRSSTQSFAKLENVDDRLPALNDRFQ